MKQLARFEYANVVITLEETSGKYEWCKSKTTIAGMFIETFTTSRRTTDSEVARKWFEQSVRSVMFELKTENIFA